jgi:hypothetical protein
VGVLWHCTLASTQAHTASLTQHLEFIKQFTPTLILTHSSPWQLGLQCYCICKMDRLRLTEKPGLAPGLLMSEEEN